MAYPKKVKFKIMENANQTIKDFFANNVGNPTPHEIEKWWEITEVNVTETTYTRVKKNRLLTT